MNKIYFVTGNSGKFQEAKTLLPNIEQVSIELPEEQHIDPKYVISKKLEVAKGLHEPPLIVEDTSLYLDGLNGFPGPLIKWMEEAVRNEGIYNLCRDIGNNRAIAKTVIGYYDGDKTEFFEGEVSGQIVKPYGNEGFGWDSIFQPDGVSETFAEMGEEFKAEFSMRTMAFTGLSNYLSERN